MTDQTDQPKTADERAAERAEKERAKRLDEIDKTAREGAGPYDQTIDPAIVEQNEGSKK